MSVPAIVARREITAERAFPVFNSVSEQGSLPRRNSRHDQRASGMGIRDQGIRRWMCWRVMFGASICSKTPPSGAIRR
jgi:hypothetical protein